ncbi:MAG: alpha/beta fold hydrolase [Gammaproteobacteria bacterium]|nr:alpha/beta fold hydrolase [Gammaproteobacteria bacterium]
MEKSPFNVDIENHILEDLFTRLRNARYADDLENDDWRYGTPTAYLKDLVEYWIEEYDWRKVEQEINYFSHFRTQIDEMPIHFIHQAGNGPAPIPLILSHGWPWTFWDFKNVIEPLCDPGSFGGDPEDAFDVVVPSLPGFGFSTPLNRTGINFWRTADIWSTLMRDVLGYERFAAQGGDWGSIISAQLGHKYADQLIGVHLSLSFPLDFFVKGLPGEDEYEDDEKHNYHHTQGRMAHATSHVSVQCTDPQTLASALHDSPVGLLSWLVERRRNWSDCGGDVESVFSREDLITTAMIYWVSNSFVTSARFYWESAHHLWSPVHDRMPAIEAPTAIALFPEELCLMPRKFLHNYYNLKQLHYMPEGGHFAPSEQPELLVNDVRTFFRQFRD